MPFTTVLLLVIFLNIPITQGFQRYSSGIIRRYSKTFQENWRLRSTLAEVSVISESSVQLSWAQVANSRSYKVEFNREGGPYNMIVVTVPNVSLTSLSSASLYTYKISSLLKSDENTFTPVCSGTFSTKQSEATGSGDTKAEVTELSRLEIRIGKILEISKHPEADSLYVEKVDVGEPEPRTIVSGLVEFCPIETMQGREVVVLCNLKPRALKGITSFGMLLCASSADHTKVEPLGPPKGSKIGQLVTFEGHAAQPVEAGNRATKAYSKIADEFFVNDEGVATYKGTPFMTAEGPCTASLKGKIS